MRLQLLEERRERREQLVHESEPSGEKELVELLNCLTVQLAKARKRWTDRGKYFGEANAGEAYQQRNFSPDASTTRNIPEQYARIDEDILLQYNNSLGSTRLGKGVG